MKRKGKRFRWIEAASDARFLALVTLATAVAELVGHAIASRA